MLEMEEKVLHQRTPITCVSHHLDRFMHYVMLERLQIWEFFIFDWQIITNESQSYCYKRNHMKAIKMDGD